MEGPVASLGKHLVGLHHCDDVVVLDRNLEVAETAFLEEGGLPDGGFDKRLRGGRAVFFEQPRVERPRVDADAKGDAAVRGGLADVGDLVVELSYVSGVDPDGPASGLNGGENVLGLEVNVRYDGNSGLLGDDLQRGGVFVRGACDADDVAPCGRELGDLLEGRADVVGLRRGHRLH